MTSHGGAERCHNHPSCETSQVDGKSTTSKRTQTQAQASALVSSSARGGEHGAYSQAGRSNRETLGGQRQSEWNYSSKLFSGSALYRGSKYTGTTTESLKAGGQAEAETKKPTKSSEGFINFWKSTKQFYPPDTSTPPRIPQMALREASTPHNTSYSPRSNFPSKFVTSSLTSTHPPNPAKELILRTFLQSLKRPSPEQNNYDEVKLIPTQTTLQMRQPKRPRLVDLLEKPPLANPAEPPTSSTQGSHLQALKPSPLRPHCNANDRIRTWKRE